LLMQIVQRSDQLKLMLSIYEINISPE